MQALKNPFVKLSYALRTCRGLPTARLNTSTKNYGSYCKQAHEWSRSEVKVHKATYAWTIENFDFFERKGTPVYSPVYFFAPTNRDAKWYLQVKPNGESFFKDNVTIWLYLNEDSRLKEVFAWYTFTIFNDEPKKSVSNTSNLQKFHADGYSAWGFKNFCEKDENFRRDFLSDNVLKIYCEVNYHAVEHHYYRNRSTPSLESTTASSITSGNLKTSNNRVLEDFNISVNGKDYPAHKAILAERSKVFAAMFERDTKENPLNRIDIEDLSEEIVSEMLRFIYTGKCEKLDELAEGLLAAADKYHLTGLKAICSESLCKNLSIENAAKILLLADKHNASELKSQVTNYIVANSAKVFDTDGWKNIQSYPVLLEEIVKAAVRQ